MARGDLPGVEELATLGESGGGIVHDFRNFLAVIESGLKLAEQSSERPERVRVYIAAARGGIARGVKLTRSEEHTSELQSLMRISYAVFCLQRQNYTNV